MHSNQQLWIDWSEGRISDDEAQAAAEAGYARAAISGAGRGHGSREKVFGPTAASGKITFRRGVLVGFL
jgi:hypothetical protein